MAAPVHPAVIGYPALKAVEDLVSMLEHTSYALYTPLGVEMVIE